MTDSDFDELQDMIRTRVFMIIGAITGLKTKTEYVGIQQVALYDLGWLNSEFIAIQVQTVFLFYNLNVIMIRRKHTVCLTNRKFLIFF